MRWRYPSTRKVTPPGGVGLAQAHPSTKPPAMTKQPSAGLGPLPVHSTHSVVGPRIIVFNLLVARTPLLLLLLLFIAPELGTCRGW